MFRVETVQFKSEAIYFNGMMSIETKTYMILSTNLNSEDESNTISQKGLTLEKKPHVAWVHGQIGQLQRLSKMETKVCLSVYQVSK